MLVSIAFVLVSPRAWPGFSQRGVLLSELTPLPLAQTLLEGSGYDFRPEWSVESDGTLAKGDHRVRVRVLNATDYVPPKGRTVLQLSAQIDVPRELPQVDVEALGRDLVSTPRVLSPGRVVFAPSLGRTVTAHGDVALDARSTPEGTKAAIDRYFATVDAYARSHGGRWAFHSAKDWGRGSLDDGLVLNRFDFESVRRLLRSWGLDPRFPYSRNDRETTVRVFGPSVSILGPLPGRPNDDGVLTLSGGVVSMSPARARAWRRAAKGAERRVEFQGTGGFLKERLPLPLRAGELKRRLFAFARDVKALERRRPGPASL